MTTNLNQMTREEILQTFVEVDLIEPDNFRKLRETLTRIGISNNKNKTLYQSCHILHKKGRYYICHFKELLALDMKNVDYSDEDRARRNSIAKLVESWGLCKIISTDLAASPILGDRNGFKVIPHQKKSEWDLVTKYNIGNVDNAKG